MTAAHDPDMVYDAPGPPRRTPGMGLRVAIVLVVVVGVGFAYGILHNQTDTAGAAGAAGTRVRVQVVKPKAVQSDVAFDLPGVIRPLEETLIYPQTTGYVRSWLVDIGDKVTAGQLLAEIAVPELDAQLEQARAQLLQAQAALSQTLAQSKYSSSNATRYTALGDQELIAKQQVEQTAAQADTDAANVAAARANVAAQTANVHRLTETKTFSKVVAPFAGTITQRNVDRGTLVNASQTIAMFQIVANDPVRVFLDVPQTVASSVKVGSEAKLTVREFGDKQYTGTITRTAGALDAGLHTMTTEIDVPNPENTLLAGMYVRASLTLARPHKVVEIPATALYSDAAGLRVAKVDPQNRIKFVKITIERDTGATVQIASGLAETDRILKVTVPSLAEGDAVDILPSPPPAAGSGSGHAGSGSASSGSAAGSGATR